MFGIILRDKKYMEIGKLCAIIVRKGFWVMEGDNVVVDAIKLILLIYNNFSIVKKVVNKIVRVK